MLFAKWWPFCHGLNVLTLLVLMLEYSRNILTVDPLAPCVARSSAIMVWTLYDRSWALSQFKDCLFMYGDFHFKDKTLLMGIPILVRQHLYWDEPLYYHSDEKLL